MKKLPVFGRKFDGNEIKYLTESVRQGEVSRRGKFVRKFEEAFARWSGTKYAVAVCSGTAALEAAIWAVVPNLTRNFAQNINDCRYVTGARLGIRADTIISALLASSRLGITVKLYDKQYDKKKKVIDYYDKETGNLRWIIRSHLFGKWENTEHSKAVMIDDASQYWQPFPVKDVACYSLYYNKMITAGEGGIVVTDKPYIFERVKAYREMCRNKKNHYSHTHLGNNLAMSNLQAALALAQLEKIDKYTEIKQRNRDLYKKYLPGEAGIEFDVPVPWMYLITTKYPASKIVNALGKKGIECRRYFYPLHRIKCLVNPYNQLLSYPHRRFVLESLYEPYKIMVQFIDKPDIIGGLKESDFPYANYMWKHAFYLPSGMDLTKEDIKYVCQKLRQVLRQAK